ncbi:MULTISPECIES: hypothetical protein [unclassified Moorena]|nr:MULTISPECIES: hypothetical protein [unclassified Moorena]
MRTLREQRSAVSGQPSAPGNFNRQDACSTKMPILPRCPKHS